MSHKKTALTLSALFALLLCGSALGATFQVDSFGLDKDKIFLEPGFTENVIATVFVRNLDTGAAEARVVISVEGPDGTEVAALRKEFTGNFEPDSSTEVIFLPNPPGNSFPFSDAMAPGNYTFYASVYNDAPPVSLDSQKMRVLTLAVKRAVPVPEFQPLLPALIAFSVIAMLFFSGWQKSKP